MIMTRKSFHAILTLILIGLSSLTRSVVARPFDSSLDHYYITTQYLQRPNNETHISYYDKPSRQHATHVQAPETVGRLTPEAYFSMRDMFFRYEESKALGADMRLNKLELQANEIIMDLKMKEYAEGLATPHLFKPSQHIFKVLDAINASPLFHLLQKMPKGGILHAHDTALCSTDFLIQLTYRPNLWICQKRGSAEGSALHFFKQRPTMAVPGSDCEWELLSDVRQERGAHAVDEYLREGFSMYPTQKFDDVNAAWVKFGTIFGLIDGMLTYAPVWADYYYNALKEFYADGVQYLEFRSTLPTLYDLEGKEYTQLDTVRIYTETLEKFMKENPGFIGSRMIYAPSRNIDDSTVEHYIRTCSEIKAKYPEFVAGFDLVGQEELGRPLKDLIPLLLTIPDDIDFFFHAGETNWYGSSVDENLIDAILLGTKRIGHGFGVVKHPLVLEMIKERNIAIEVNPVSNQVLQLVSDYRNHPCSQLFSDNYPVVISSDDPSLWRAAPLSHDFYIAFLGIASAHADLRFLKKLAVNSIQFSSLGDREKASAFLEWEKKWEDFISFVVTGKENAAPSSKLVTMNID